MDMFDTDSSPHISQPACRYYAVRLFTLRLIDSGILDEPSFDALWKDALAYLGRQGITTTSPHTTQAANDEHLAQATALIMNALGTLNHGLYARQFEADYHANLQQLIILAPVWTRLLTTKEIWAAEHSSAHYRHTGLSHFVNNLAITGRLSHQEADVLDQRLNGRFRQQENSGNLRLARSITAEMKESAYTSAATLLRAQHPDLFNEFERHFPELKRQMLANQQRLDQLEHAARTSNSDTPRRR